MPPPRNRRIQRCRRPAGAPREEDSTLEIGPSNALWFVATTATGDRTSAGWWKFSDKSDPTGTDEALSRVYRMNGQPTTSVRMKNGTGRHEEDHGRLSRLAAGIRDSYSREAEDLALFWHGVHINVHIAIEDENRRDRQRRWAATDAVPHQLRTPDEEYYGQVHHTNPRNRRPVPSREMLKPDYNGSRPEQSLREFREAHPGASEEDENWWRESHRQNTRYHDMVMETRERRQNWDEDLFFNWPVGGDAPEYGRYDVDSYREFCTALKDHPTVKRVHLYGCDLADQRYLRPILDLTLDIANGGSRPSSPYALASGARTDLEVWVYSDFTQTAFDGCHLYISHEHNGRSVAKGVTWRPFYNRYEVVALYSDHGPLPGWQVRGRIENGKPVVEKLVERTDDSVRPTWTGAAEWPEGNGWHIEQIDADGVANASDARTIPILQEPVWDSVNNRMPSAGTVVPLPRYPYTPFHILRARYIDRSPGAPWSIRDFMPDR